MHYHNAIRGISNFKYMCYRIRLIQLCDDIDSRFKYLRLTFNHTIIVHFQTLFKICYWTFFFIISCLRPYCA